MNETGYFYGEHKRRLFYQSWKIKQPKGIFVITHGLSENTDRYEKLALSLNEDQWNVYAWDLRGHGRSTGIRGYVKQFRLYTRDFIHFLTFMLSKELERLPIVLFGHSLGALVVSRSFMHEENLVTSADGICLTAPAFGLRMNTSLLNLVLGYTAHFVCPWITFYNKIVSSYLSRDPYFQNILENDLFRHNRISSEIYLNVLNNPKMIRQPRTVKCCFLIQLAGKDMVIDNHIAQQYFYDLKSSRPKKLILYPESMHQILEDFGKDKVIFDLKQFIAPLRKN